MRGAGQIRDLARVARPDLGVITSIAPVHLEQMGSLENIARAKAELLDELPAGAVAVLPEDAPALEPFVPEGLDVRRFGEPEARDPRRPHARALARARGRVRLHGAPPGHERGGGADRGRGTGVEPPVEPVEVEFSLWRSQETELPGGGLLINDSWNANPVAMRAALAHLLERAGGRRTVAILGEMAELGPRLPATTRRLRARPKAWTSCSASASSPGTTGPTNGAPTAAEAVEAARGLVRPGDAILVKGSRAVGLEVVADALLEPQP